MGSLVSNRPRQSTHSIMPRNGIPGFLSPADYSPSMWASDCQPRPHDLPREVQPVVLMQAARKVYAARYPDPRQAEALAVYEAGSMLAIMRHARRDTAAVAAELGMSHADYQAAARVAVYETSGDVTDRLRAYEQFLNELNIAVKRMPPGPQQLRALAAALADRSEPNALWANKFVRDGTYPHTAAFMANLQEKFARELPREARHAFLRDCAAPGFGVRRMVLAFRARFAASHRPAR